MPSPGPRSQKFRRGSVIWAQNSAPDDSFLILREGRAQMHYDAVQMPHNQLVLHPGDTFGLVSALTRNSRRQMVTAMSDCVVIRVPLSQLSGFFRKQKETCLKMIARYSRELQSLDEMLTGSARNSGSQETRLWHNLKAYQAIGRQDVAEEIAARVRSAAASGRLKPDAELAALFDSVPEAQRPPQGVKTGNRLNLPKGAYVFTEHEPSDGFYVVRKGRVAISRIVSGKEYILAILSEGEIFGEMAVLQEEGRNASAYAFEDAELLVLQKDSFLGDLGDALLEKLFTSFARRIWYAYQRVFIFRINEPNAKLYSYLQILISDYRARTGKFTQMEFVFSFGISELKKMTGLSETPDELIRDFLGDGNVEISRNTILIRDRSLVDDKVLMYKNRLRAR